jgi:uncharacterized protein YndB with AHSA1/START domain
MRRISATVDIAATPERVWAVLADLAAYPEWNPFIRSASGKLTEGARLTLQLVPGRGPRDDLPADGAGGAAGRVAALDRPAYRAGHL